MIELDHVTKAFGDGAERTVAVDDLTLSIAEGEVVALVGSSGSGKTTTLRMINRLIEPTSGTITVDGRDVSTIPAHELRRGIGYVIQQGGLFPHRTVLANVMTVPRLLGWDRGRARTAAMEALEKVGLTADQARRYPAQLSGGQQQRVGIARALALRPKLMLFDEPTSALDPELVGEVLAVIRDLATSGWTLMIVTHEIRFARDVADQVLFLDGGVIAERGGAEVLHDPQHERTKQFLRRVLEPG